LGLGLRRKIQMLVLELVLRLRRQMLVLVLVLRRQIHPP
jgi:hypothetical protein